MIYYKGNQWHISTELIKYKQHNEEIEQMIGLEGKQWWIDFANEWEHTEIVEIVGTVVPQEQLDRLEQVNTLSVTEDNIGFVELYVETGQYIDGKTHPLRALQLEEEIVRQGIELSEREINEIIMGMQISDMEITLLELQMGGN